MWPEPQSLCRKAVRKARHEDDTDGLKFDLVFYLFFTRYPENR